MWEHRESVLLQEPYHKAGQAGLKRLGQDKFMEAEQNRAALERMRVRHKGTSDDDTTADK